MNRAMLLFSFDIIHLAIVPAPDPLAHIVIQQLSPTAFKVVQDAHRLQMLFRVFEQLSLVPVCYSSKNCKHTAPVLAKINSNLDWIYFGIDKQNSADLKPNCARLRRVNNSHRLIQYGQGYSNSEGKQQLLIAACSALGVSIEQSKNLFILYQTNAQQVGRLKQCGYQNICQIKTQMTEAELLSQLSYIITKIEQSTTVSNKQLTQFIQNCPQLTPKYVSLMQQFNYFQNKRNIVPSISLSAANSPPIYRLPGSLSVSAVVFRFAGDKQIYVAQAQLPCNIGGELQYETQQNKILASVIYQTLAKIDSFVKGENTYRFACLPLQISQFMMRHSLIKSYNKNKANFIVRPYIKSLKTLAQIMKQQSYQTVIQLLRQGKLHGKLTVEGIGRCIIMSLLLGEQVSGKQLFQNISIFKKQQSSSQINTCRIGFNTCFNKHKQISKLYQLQFIIGTKNEHIFKLSQLNSRYLEQMRQTLILILQSLPLIKSVFHHNIWLFNKDTQLDNFMGCFKNMCQLFKIMGQQQWKSIPNILKTMSISKIHPQLLNNLIGYQQSNLYPYFTKPVSYHQGELAQFGIGNRNIYEDKIEGTDNFIIYGQAVPVYTLMRWIKSRSSGLEIIYISLLLHKTENYIKQAKLAKSDKRNVLFIIDHCEIQQADGQLPEGKSITDSNWGLRTIFIFRSKLGSYCKKLSIVHDPLTCPKNEFSAVQSKLLLSHEQTFRTIFQIGRESKDHHNKFKTYMDTILLYIKTKWASYGCKAGIHSYEMIVDKLKQLVRAIRLKQNRIGAILKDKEFNNINYLVDSKHSTVDEVNSQRESTVSIFSIDASSWSRQHLKNVPNALIILYCLPIYIYNQRLWLLHDIYQFLQAHYLHIGIVNLTWDGNLSGEQLKIFQQWYPLIIDKQQIKKQLLELLCKFQRETIKKKSKMPLIGNSSGMEDCLQLAMKVQIDNLFYKLDTMFHLDSPMQNMIKINRNTDNQEYLILTRKGSVYAVNENNENKKITWKSTQIYQNNSKINLYYQLGQANSNKTKLYGIKMSEYNKYVIVKENKIQIIQISITQNSSQQCNIILDCHNLINEPIVKLKMVENKICIFLFVSGRLATGIINYLNDQTWNLLQVSQFNSPEITHLKDVKQSIIQYWPQNDGRVLISYAKTIQIESNASKHSEIYITFMVASNNDDKILISSPVTTNISCRAQMRSIGLAQKDNIIQILAFQQYTNILCIWQVQWNNFDHVKSKPTMKLYRIQNQPVSVFKFDDVIYVGSQYSFVKRMIPYSKSQNKINQNIMVEHG